jgi:protein TonB
MVKPINIVMLNTSLNLYKTEWLDLVFKNRNKTYGAYALRASAASTTVRAFFIGAPVFILFFAGPLFYQHFYPDAVVIEHMDRVIDLDQVYQIPPVEKPKPPVEKPSPKAEPLKEKLKTVNIPSKPKVVENPTVEPPTLKDVENAVVGIVTQDGVNTDLNSVPVKGDGSGIGTGTGSGDGVISSDHIFTENIEAFPEFEGGMKAWAKYLQRNLRYPDLAEQNGVQGKVIINFIVERDGSISNVTVVNGPGYGLNDEAVRVIKKSPNWKPGRQNGQNVRVRFSIPIGFRIF